MAKKLSLNQQVNYIEGHLKKRGIEPDLVDVAALIDPELNYSENLANVLEQAGASSTGKAGAGDQEIVKNPACTEAKKLKDEITEHQKADDALQNLKAELKDLKTRCDCNSCQQMGIADPHNYPVFPESWIIRDGLLIQRTLSPSGKFSTRLNPNRKIKAKINNPADVYQVVEDMGDEDREFGKVLYLDTKNQITGIDIVSVGSLNAAVVHPREVLKGAMLNNAASIIFVHNHPSGNPEPSREDIEISKKLQETGSIIGIPLLDSVVIGKGKHFSIKEAGMIADPHNKGKDFLDEFADDFDNW